MEADKAKALRHRFYKLGTKRDCEILRDLGKLSEQEDIPSHDEMKPLLMDLIEEGRASDLVFAIEHHEEEIREEKENARLRDDLSYVRE